MSECVNKQRWGIACEALSEPMLAHCQLKPYTVTHFNEIWLHIRWLTHRKMNLKIPSAKWLSCLSIIVLMTRIVIKSVDTWCQSRYHDDARYEHIITLAIIDQYEVQHAYTTYIYGLCLNWLNKYIYSDWLNIDHSDKWALIYYMY